MNYSVETHDKEAVKIQASFKNNLKFIIPSIIGVLLFMIPIKFEGNITIPIAILSGKLAHLLGPSLPYIISSAICISALGSIITVIFKPKFILKNEFLNTLFNLKPTWFIARVSGAIFCLFVLTGIGPEFILSKSTGGFVLNSLLNILFSIFFFAGLFLPLLLNFGLLEFFGAILTKIMRPLFKLPGRSSIDCITSWLGDGTLGIMLTSKQYEEGFYSRREASIISTTFSAVSITFSLIVVSQVGLSHMFIPFYLTVTFSGIVAAIIIPRIAPLSKIPDTYYNNQPNKDSEEIPEGYTSLSWGYNKALNKAATNVSVSKFFKDGFANVIDMWLGVLPVVMALATSALVIAEFTPIFKILGLPFVPLLMLLQVPEAVAASQTIVVGFADMLLPSVLAANTITSEMTKFIVACTSVAQLIYMSEVGGVLLGSKIPISIKQLLIIFLERTLITLPVIVLIANLLF
ncbi:YjiH family protein [Clostridium gasigenes]|uniref:YjiH family protein n=1 Tax=Clostridium gasigenes TaxID=94869 RepID=UPI0014383D08|nr:YjiH family protein [Clostridium gasigenes]NKF07943.1 YjiH family protein [Clostridium gasigenes]QSW20680.1 YjiH family protein [Clostridium gasigenes]